MTTTSQTQVVREAPEIEGYKLGLLQSANRLIQTQVPVPVVQAATMSPQQIQALSLAGTGIESYRPFLSSAADLYAGSGVGYQQLPTYGQRAISEAQGTKDLARPLYQEIPGFAQRGLTAAQAAGEEAKRSYGSLAQYAEQGYSTAEAARRAAELQYAGLGEIGRAGAEVGAQYGSSAAGLGVAGAQAYDPRSVSAYMNPYQQEVTRNALAEMSRQAQIQQQGLSAQAVRAGAFGGSREGIQRSELGRNLAEVQSRRILEDYFANYSQAQQAAMNAFANQQMRAQTAGNIALGAGQLGLSGLGQAGQLQQAQAAGFSNLGQLGLQAASQAGQLQQAAGAGQINIGQLGVQAAGQAGNLQQAAAQGIGSLGQLGVNAAVQGGQLQQASAAGIGALGQQTAALGQLQSGLQQGDVSFLYNIGTQQQQQRQRELDAQRQTQLQALYEPYQRLGFLSDIYKGAPTTQMTIGQTTAPNPSLVSQVAGLGTAALAAYNLAKAP